jgi:hypothetical protein
LLDPPLFLKGFVWVGLVIGSMNHRVGSDKRLVADSKSAKTVDINTIIETYVVAKFYELSIEPNNLVKVEAAFTDPLGITRTKRNNALALGSNHHGNLLFVAVEDEYRWDMKS